eukprot:scaffold167_cov244-Pinguiococcus_pyrenoidosus.AAC.6
MSSATLEPYDSGVFRITSVLRPLSSSVHCSRARPLEPAPPCHAVVCTRLRSLKRRANMHALLGGRRSGNERGYGLLNVLGAIGDLCFLVALQLARCIGAILQLVYGLGGVLGLKALLNVGVENEAGDNATSDDINKGAFDFDWGVAAQFLLLLLTLLPFAFLNQRWLALLCLSFALCYALLIRRDRRRNCRDPNLEALDRRFPPPLLPLLGLCYAGVATVLGMAAHKLQGPPLCFARCKTCLGRWKAAVFFQRNETDLLDGADVGDYYEAEQVWMSSQDDDVNAELDDADPAAYCGAANGAELVGFFAVAQSATFIFLSGIVVIIVCLAWSLSNFEKNKRKEAVKWLKTENCLAFALREELCLKVGPPGTDPRVSLDREWIYCGIGFALAFSNLGLKRWRDLNYSKRWTYLYVLLHICITFISFMLIHVGFYGRLRVLYLRSLSRTKLLTQQLSEILKSEEEIDAQKVEEGRAYNSGNEYDLEDDYGLFMPEAQPVDRFSDSEVPVVDSIDPVNSNISLTRAGSISNSSLQGAEQVEKFILCVDAQRSSEGRRLEAWWTERLFVFITDITLDYSMAGLGMSTTFVLVLALFALVSIQLWNEGFWGLLAPPASYCVCGISYMVYCMYQMLEIAKETYCEQQNHGEYLSRYRAMLQPNSAKVDYVNSMLVQIREYDPLPTVMGFPIRPKGPHMFDADRA